MTTTQFADLGIVQDLVDALAERGITAPVEIQALAIPDGLAGRGRHFSVGPHLAGRQVGQHSGHRCLKRREPGAPVRLFGHRSLRSRPPG